MPRSLGQPNVTKDAGIKSLTAALTKTSLTTPVYHELVLHYPACDLLPHGKQPYLAQPIDVEFREQPHPSDYHLDPMDLEHLALISVLPNPQQDELPASTLSGSLLGAMSRLSQTPGTSLLEVVAYSDGDQMLHHVRLSTSWKTPTGWWAEEEDFYLDELDWWSETKEAVNEGWMKMLQSLMQRETVVAYLHVRQRLLDFDQAFVVEEEKSWPETWALASEQLPTARELLCGGFRKKTADGQTKPLGSLAELEGSAVSLMLPCGHRLCLSIAKLHRATDDGLLHTRCKTDGCDQSLLKDDDLKIALQASEKRRRVEFSKLRTQWYHLETHMDTHDWKLEFFLTDIPDAVDDALSSLRAPKSVLPPELSPMGVPEVKQVQEGMRNLFAAGGLSAKVLAQDGKPPNATRSGSMHQAYLWLRRAAFRILRREFIADGKVKELAAPSTWSLKFERMLDLWMWRTAMLMFAVIQTDEDTDTAFKIATEKLEAMMLAS